MTTNDYPADALMQEAQGTTTIELSVGADGRPTGCRVPEGKGSGNASLDNAACSAAVRRARFYPALDKKGNPIAGAYRTQIRWQIPEDRPEAVPTSQTVTLAYIIEKDGSVTNCRFKSDPEILFDACSQIDSFSPPTNALGEPVRKRFVQAIVIKVEDVPDKAPETPAKKPDKK